jgi:uncharacterized protein (DUF362 family)
VGQVYEEFARDLDRWRDSYQGNPQGEIIHLLLLALEREEIVSVAYRDTMLVRRLRSMPIPYEIQELMRHALIWAWKDEEMHAVYLRGAILKLGSLSLRIRAWLHQMAGAAGGWSSAVRQHTRWRTAPLSHSLATLFTWAGMLTGQVPEDVRQYLRYRPFRDFCLFNVDAELTARLCYERLLALLRAQPGRAPELIEDFSRVKADEERHTRIFQILADALDDQDRLAAGETRESLTQKIGAVGEFFLPRAERSQMIADNPVGSGGRVWVLRGKTPDDKLPLFRRLLDEAGLADQLEARARVLGKPIGDLRIAIKPTFMMGYHRKDRSPVSDPTLLEDLARLLRERGCTDIAVVEARNMYDHFYRNRSVAEVARYFDLASPLYRLADLTDEQMPHAYFRGMVQYSVGRTWKEADFRISFGKLRSHPTDLVYLALANLEGLGARCDEFIFSERQMQRDTALMMLIGDFPPHFAILDGYEAIPDGLLGIMGAPRPKSPRRFYAGADALAVDMVAARHLGLRNPRVSCMLDAACHWFGDPSARIAVVGLNEAVAGWRGPYHNEWSTLLSFLAHPVYEFGSWRGALFVSEMDEQAFPSILPERLPLRLARRGLQAMLGLRHPR